jgi:hypothetical protein
MSVSPEQPRDVTPTPTSPPTSAPLPQAPAFPEASAPESTGYQPLSLMALGSFLLALIFALVLIGGAVTAFIMRSPLLLPPWMLLLALAVLLLAWVARRQIQASEGTLGGLALTNWSFGLCLVLAPLYAAYYGATYFAVTAQAEHFSRRYLQLLGDGETEKAFWMTVPAEQRPAENMQSRNTLEITFNQINEQGRAPYNGFLTAELTRLLRNGGKGLTLNLVGINDWAYEMGGYRVSATYQVTTKLATFQVLVTTQGVTGSTGGRQWQIVDRGTVRLASEPLRFTDAEGERFVQAAPEARNLVDAWANKLNSNDPEGAFLLSLPADEVKSQAARQTRLIAQGLLCGPLPGLDPTSRQALANRQNWFGGYIYDKDPKRFWTTPAARASAVENLNRLLLNGPAAGGRVQLIPMVTPLLISSDPGSEQLGYDVLIILPRPGTGEQPLAVDAAVVVRFKTGANGQLSADGIERIDLRSARSMPPPPQPGKGGPGGPGGPMPR